MRDGIFTYARKFEKVGPRCEMWAGGIREGSEQYGGVYRAASRPAARRYGS
jgi:hypothetical protein